MRSSFNEGWFVKPKQNRFLEMGNGGVEPVAVTLPHDAMIGTERNPSASPMNAYFPDGVWVYTKTFDVPVEWRDRRVHLQFEGVYRDAVVFVNDDVAAAEPYGYGEFSVDLDPFLRHREQNTVTVECRAGDDSRWYSGAGIYRPVHLWAQHPVRLAIDGVSIATPEIDGDGAVVEVTAEVRNDTGHTVTVQVASEVRDAGGAVVASGRIPVTVRPHTTVWARQRLYLAGPARWSPEAPNLYSCLTTLAATGDDEAELDRDETAFGIRSLQLDPRHGLRINGTTVKLRGACVHHDNGPIGAATITRAEERRVELLQGARFNAIRSAHNPLSRAMLDACDRLGVIVMDEAWDTWTESKRDHDHALRFADRWRADVAAMIRKDRNHPSVIMYSTGNEIPEVGSPLGAALGREIAEHVRALDPTRHVTNAVQPLLAIRDLIPRLRELAGVGADQGEAPQGVNTQMTAWADIKDRVVQTPLVDECIEEVCASLDVAGYNYLDSRYLMDQELHPGRVIVGSETYVTAIGRSWPTITAHDHLIGDFTWTGWDYLGEVGIGRRTYVDDEGAAGERPSVMAPYPWLLAHAGDIDITGVRRAQSFYREVVFGLRHEPYLAVQRPGHAGQQEAFSGPWSWSDTLGSWTWDGFEGVTVGVEVYSAADEVELWRNGVSLGRRPAGPAHDFRAEYETTYEPGELVAVAYVDGTEVARSSLRTADGSLRLHVHGDRTELEAGDADLAYLALAIADEDGIVNPTADRRVTVTVSGPAVVQGFASADPRATEPYGSSTCTTYEGRALAVVRPTGEGDITLEFAADGFEPAVCRLCALPADGF